MYNEEIKLRFIQYYTSAEKTEKVCRYTFKVISKHEIAAGKDVAMMNGAETKEVIESISGLRNHSKYNKLAMLKAYINWYRDNIDSSAPYREIGIDMQSNDKYRSRMIASPKHLAKILDDICCPESYDTTDNMIRVYCWLVYAGLNEEEARSVTETNVDFKHATVVCGVKNVPIYRESIYAFEKAVDLRRIAHYASSDAGERSYIDRAEGKELIRGMYKVPAALSLRNEISNRCTAASSSGSVMKISVQRIWLSGVFFRTYEYETVGIKPDFTQYANEYADERDYEDLEQKRKSVVRKRKEYLNDYLNWKTAFGYN